MFLPKIRDSNSICQTARYALRASGAFYSIVDWAAIRFQWWAEMSHGGSRKPKSPTTLAAVSRFLSLPSHPPEFLPRSSNGGHRRRRPI